MKSIITLKFIPQVLCPHISRCSFWINHQSPPQHIRKYFYQQIRKFSVPPNISVSDPTFLKHLDRIEGRYVQSLEEGKVFNLNLDAEFAKSVDVQGVESLFKEIAAARKNVATLQELNTEGTKEMDDMVKKEMKEYEDQITLLKNQILEALIPVDEEDKLTDVILEVNAGVGGQEAMLFACELFDMYSAYILRKGWSCEVIDFSKSDLGGIRKGCVQVSGKDSCRLLRFEGGVHRVQRVPKTEKAGRIHTSTVSVAVLPRPSEADVVIAEKDLKIETKRSSGAGGQAVQTSDSAVRIVHLPTGIAVDCQVERFQHKNKELALQKLRALLYQRHQDEAQSKISSSRKIQVGSRGRSEKIRTYNFNQDRVTDHRIGKNIHNLSSFLEGGDLLDEMIHLVHNKYKLEQLEAVFNSMTAV